MNEDELERFRRLEVEAKAIHSTNQAEAARRKAPERSAPQPQEAQRGASKREGALDLDVGSAIEIARSAKGELDKPRERGEKSLLVSGGVSLVFGPVGWLYAGSWRESIPAAAGWLAAAAIASKVFPMFLLMPVLMVVMPVSGIAGLVYAWQYNRKGRRTRLFKNNDANSRQDPAADKRKR